MSPGLLFPCDPVTHSKSLKLFLHRIEFIGLDFDFDFED
jgi:hypothetical protein